MSDQALSIVIVGDVDPHCLSLLKETRMADVRHAPALSAIPIWCAAQPADVILLGAMQFSSFDTAIIDTLRQQDAALARYTCVVQCINQHQSVMPMPEFMARADDFLDVPADQTAFRLRLKLFGRIAALETQLRQLKARGHHGEMLVQDTLTGLGNWRYLTNHLESLLAETQARGGLACCALLTVDRLDYLTERHGQIVRSEALRGVAARLRKILRPMDVIARTSDNEFGIALRYNGKGRLRPWLFERLLRAVSYPSFVLGKQEMEITISVGVCCNEAQSEFTPFDMLAIAAAKMREAQAAGGNLFKI